MNTTSVNGASNTDAATTDAVGVPFSKQNPFRDRRSLALSSLVSTVATMGVAALFMANGDKATTTAAIVVRSIWLYGAFTVLGLVKQFGASWAKTESDDQNETGGSPIQALRHIGFAWAASAVIQAVSVLTSFSRPILLTVAVCDLALRVFAWERARAVKRGLHLASPNPLVLSGFVRTVAGVMMLFALTAFNYSGNEFLLAECAAGIFAVMWSDMALSKRLSMVAPAATSTAASTVALTASVAVPAVAVASAKATVIDLTAGLETEVKAETVIDLRSTTNAPAAIELDEHSVTLALPDTQVKTKVQQ
jgi:hypothetical protein